MSADYAPPAIAARDAAAEAAGRARLDALTKPLGSLGRLEDVAAVLCGMAGRVLDRPLAHPAILVGAGDHGVCAEGVSAYPAEVTPQMVATILAGRAAVSAFARAAGARVVVADFGVAAPLAPHADLLELRVASGTANLARGDAMPLAHVGAALRAGEAAVAAILARGPCDVLALGEMGIGNTTPAAAITAVLAGAASDTVVGRGTGLGDAGLACKRAVVAAACEPLRGAPWQRVAAAAGGYEIVALAGAILACAARRLPAVLDGAIVGAAALLAQRIAPAAIGYCIASHRSREPGHAIALAALGLEPLLDLDLRLGEASGAALALPLVGAASRALVEMRTFAEAGVATAAPPARA